MHPTSCGKVRLSMIASISSTVHSVRQTDQYVVQKKSQPSLIWQTAVPYCLQVL
jgi:hypothetical protein